MGAGSSELRRPCCLPGSASVSGKLVLGVRLGLGLRHSNRGCQHFMLDYMATPKLILESCFPQGFLKCPHLWVAFSLSSWNCLTSFPLTPSERTIHMLNAISNVTLPQSSSCNVLCLHSKSEALPCCGLGTHP